MFLYFIGIDISKEWIDAAIRTKQYPRTVKHSRFDNNEKGFKLFLKWCKAQGVLDFSQLFICMEHTGVYGVPLCEFFNKKSLCYTLIPGALIANQGITRGKNDKADAKKIASFALKNHEDIRLHTLDAEAVRMLKALLGLRKRVMKAKHAIGVSFKEIQGFETQNVVNTILDNSNKMLAQFAEQLKEIDRQIDELLAEQPELKNNYELLLSVPGIGRQNALYMIVFTKNFVSFICPKKFAAFAGIAPFQSSSGKSVHSRTKVSHKANKKMKALLTGGVNNSLRSCAEYRRYFDKQIKKGKNEYSVKNVIRNKIVSRAFAIIKRGTPYVNTQAHFG